MLEMRSIAGKRRGEERRGGRGERKRTEEEKNTEKGQKAKKESKEQTVPVGGGWEVWVKREWVSTCVLGLDLDLDLACHALARLA